MKIKRSTIWKKKREIERNSWDELVLGEDMLKTATNPRLNNRLIVIEESGSIVWDSDDLEGARPNEDTLFETLNKKKAKILVVKNDTTNCTDTFTKMDKDEVRGLLKKTIRNMEMFDKAREIDRHEYETAHAQ